MTMAFSRRNLLKLGGVAALSAVGAGALASCAPSTKEGGATTAEGAASGIPSFMVRPAPITDIAETRDYDVVVVGAGASGVPAALSAAEAGAKVALIQKESKVVSQGNAGSGIDLEKSDPAGVQALVSALIAESDHRSKRTLIEKWALNSGEALKWVIERASRAGAQVSDLGNTMHPAIGNVGEYGPMNYVTANFGPKPYNLGDGMQALAAVAVEEGVEIFFSCPAEQLVQDEAGNVTGVIAKGEEGYVQFNAAKGVILATGDYQNDEEMCDYYVPDLHYFMRRQTNRTGDGHKMGMWAGAQMEPPTHAKISHDYDAGPYALGNQPFMCVNQRGQRFVNETVKTSWLNCYLRSEEDAGWYSQVFDSTYMEFAADWPGALTSPEELKNFMPEEPGEKVGVIDSFIRTYKADTLEELAAKIEVDPQAFKETVARYNELAEKGQDIDFGVPAKFLHAIETPPFYAIHRHVGVTAIVAGLEVDENNQCIDENEVPIKGLYAIGNCAGPFYCGVDYPMTVYGLSIGNAITGGYVVGRHVASL